MSIALAFDPDEAGDRATNEVLFKVLDLTDTQANYLRSYAFEGKPLEQAVKSLDNWELSDEISFWKSMMKLAKEDWWHDMASENHNICTKEIQNRSVVVNNSDGIAYIKDYNQNNPITAVLARYGYPYTAGKSVRCPMHDDTSPSLAISPDDRRAYCFNQSCFLWHDGYGVDAFDLNKIMAGGHH